MRQRRVVIKTGVLNKLLKTSGYPETSEAVFQVFPLEILLFMHNEWYTVLTNFSFPAYVISIYFKSSINYYCFALFVRTIIDGVYFPLDLVVYKRQVEKFIGFVFFSCYFIFTSIVIYFPIENRTVDSISSIFFGFLWVEREVREFNNIIVSCARDMRRLLTPYGRYSSEDNITCVYDCITQGLY